MAYLLRQTRQRIWEEGDREGALETFGRREGIDQDGVSVFAADSREQELLVVAACACEKCEGPNKIDFLHVTEAEIEPFGAVSVVEGTMALRPVNALHRVLNWSDEALAALVDSLLANGKRSTRYSIKDVTDAVAALNLEDVEEGRHRDWVQKIKERRQASSS